MTGLPLYAFDTISYLPCGGEVAYDAYRRTHAEPVKGDDWIIDGFGCVASVWERFALADTLVYRDLPLLTHSAWVTRRLVRGLLVTPEGWPKGSAIWRGTRNSCRVLPICHERLTPGYRQLVAKQASHKQVHHLRSAAAMKAFLNGVANAYPGPG